MTADLDLQRHQCEVRTLLRARSEHGRGQGWVRDYLNDPKVRGRRAALIRDIKDQLDKGSDGREGVWL